MRSDEAKEPFIWKQSMTQQILLNTLRQPLLQLLSKKCYYKPEVKGTDFVTRIDCYVHKASLPLTEPLSLDFLGILSPKPLFSHPSPASQG